MSIKARVLEVGSDGHHPYVRLHIPEIKDVRTIGRLLYDYVHIAIEPSEEDKRWQSVENIQLGVRNEVMTKALEAIVARCHSDDESTIEALAAVADIAAEALNTSPIRAA